MVSAGGVVFPALAAVGAAAGAGAVAADAASVPETAHRVLGRLVGAAGGVSAQSGHHTSGQLCAGVSTCRGKGLLFR